MNWMYHNPVALHAGAGSLAQLSAYVANLGKLLLVTSPGMVRRGSAAKLMRALEGENALPEDAFSGSAQHGAFAKDKETAVFYVPLGCNRGHKKARKKEQLDQQDLQGQKNEQENGREWVVATMGPNPDSITLESLIGQLKGQGKRQIEGIIAFGGGSVMDSAKVLAVGLAHDTDLAKWDIRYYFSHHHETAKALPYFCVPTTSGTGAEVTPFGTVWDTKGKKKYSFSAKNLFARAAFLDPTTTLSLPVKETLFGAMDAMSHSLETLWNHNSSLMGQSFARTAIRMVCEAYPKVERNPHDINARLCLQEASMLAGLAISQSRSALAHSMSYPLTSHFGVPHGLACSFTLPAIIDVVTEKKLWRHTEDEAMALQAKTFMSGLNLSNHVKEYCTMDEVLALAGEMFAPGRVENFIVPITSEDDVKDILRKSLS